MDETGFRIGGKTPWQHIASTVPYLLPYLGQARQSAGRCYDAIVADGLALHEAGPR
jgi:hypothetical protein